MELVLKDKKEARTLFVLYPVRTQQEDSHLQTKKWVLTRTYVGTLILDFLASQRGRNKSLLFKLPILCCLLQQPELRQDTTLS